MAYEVANKGWRSSLYRYRSAKWTNLTIKPEDYLEPHQLTKTITKPDLILQFAHYLAEQKRREGYEDAEVRARAMVSLNGRQPQLLIDLNVDLTKEQVSLLPARWIVPLTTPL